MNQIADVESIKILKARYCRTIDTKDWAACEQLFTPDFVGSSAGASGEPGPWDLEIKGGPQWVANVRKNIGSNNSVHHAILPEIVLTSSITATGIWAAHFGVRVAGPAAARFMSGYGHYYDTYAKSGERWLLKSMKLVIQSIDTYSSAETPAA